jgi:predicted membrane protein
MADKQTTNQARKQNLASVLIVIGLSLTVIGLFTKGTLRWILFVAAIGILFYSVKFAGKSKKSKTG